MKVLAIDGGGIRGLIPALVLAEIERRTGRRTAEMFDLIAGTSTGGILACALSRRGDDGHPMYSAEDLSQLYISEGPKIFDRSLVKEVTSAGGLLDEKYDDAGLNAALETYLGDIRLKEVLADVMLTAYDIHDRFAFFFRSARARVDDEYDFSLTEAARASSAAPGPTRWSTAASTRSTRRCAPTPRWPPRATSSRCSPRSAPARRPSPTSSRMSRAGARSSGRGR